MHRLLLFLAFFLTIGFASNAQNCSVNAGISSVICKKDSMVLFGARSGLIGNGTVSTWYQISGPSVLINSPNSLVTSVSGYDAGLYKFRVSLKCKDGLFAEDSIAVTVLPLTIANAGRDTFFCPTVISNLSANAPQVNETGVWSIVSSNLAGISIITPSNPTSSISFNPNVSGSTILRWTLTNVNGCVSYDEVVITNSGGVPLVDAGDDQVLGNCFSNTTCTNLTATNGGVGLGGQIGTWSFVSGPSLPTLTPLVSPTTKVCNLIQGTYIFRYTVSGPCATGFDEVAVIVPPPTQDITPANSNAFNSSTKFCGILNTFSMNGNSPTYTGETVLWTQTSGNPVTITNPTSPSATVSGASEYGTYCFNYSIINSASRCVTNSAVCYTFYEAGTLNAGSNQILPCNVTTATIPTVTTGEGVLNYRIISGPSGAYNSYPVNFRSSNTITGMIIPGTYRVEVNYAFGTGCSPINNFVDITVSRTPTGSNAGTDQNFACVSSTTQLAGNNPALTGLGNGRWSQISGPTTSTLVTPTNYICNVRGTIPGAYVYRWTISGGNRCPDNFDDIKVIIPDTSVTKANAGADNVICPNATYNLRGNTVRADETVLWTSIPTGITFFPSNNVNSPTISGLSTNNSYQFIYTVTNSCGSISKDTVLISTSSTAGPSFADAGPNQCLPSGTNTIQLNAILPITGTGSWSQLSGPSALISNPALFNTSVTGTRNGTYQFIWKVSSPGCLNSSEDTVLITISGNTTNANAGADIIACSNSVTLNANSPNVGTGSWSQISGDGTASISDLFNPAAIVSNLSTGLYSFRWTISNGACSSTFDDVKLSISTPPSPSIAGEDQTLCGSGATFTTLNATSPTIGTGQWVLVSGPNSPVISNASAANTSVSNLSNGIYTFRWIVAGGPSCPQSTDDIFINVSLPANAGSDQRLCNLNATTLSGNAGSSGSWTQIAGPVVAIAQSPAGNPNASVSGLSPNNTYTFRYTIPSVFGCAATFDDVVVSNGSFSFVPDAGTDEVFCNATSFTLNGSQISTDETGIWSVLSGPAGAVFLPSASAPNATLTGAVPGTYILKWTVSNAICSSSDQKRVENFATPSLANAGANQVVCFGKAILRGNTPQRGIGSWSQIDGPTNVQIAAVNNPTTEVTGLNSVGTYKFVWTISNGTVCIPNRDTVLLNVSAISPTIADAGNNETFCNQSTIQLNGNTPVSGLGNWTKVQTASAAIIVTPANATTLIQNLNSGLHQFVWSIANADNSCISKDTVTIANSVLPNTANAGMDDTFCVFNTILLTANNAIAGTSGLWSFVSGPNTPRLLSPENSICQLTGLITGTYTFRWTISSPFCTSSTDDVNITVINNADLAEAGANQTLCTQSINLFGNTPGSTNKGIWTQAEGPSFATISDASQPNTIASNLIAGTYKFVWKIYNERCFTTDTVIYVISKPAFVHAGNDVTLCNNNGQLLLTQSTVSSPDNLAAWSVISGGGILSTLSPTTQPDTVIYTAEPGFSGYILLRLQAEDACRVVTDDKSVFLQQPVVPVDAVNDSASTDLGTLSILNVLSNDILLIEDTLNFCQQNAIVITPSHGTASINSDGTVTYTPQAGFAGIDSFQYQICTQQSEDSSWIANCYKEGADSAWVFITVNNSDCFIPNAFSPNGDGINDVFIIECGTSRQFHIFNSWGIELYRNEDYQNDWNGMYSGGPLPDGTYFYSLKYMSATNEMVSKAGFICLHR
jgi:gliding motility-associated-like protein